MIVVCTGCAAKFKVADEKVGPKGAKLRCSKCGTVFMVQREEPVAPTPPPVALAQPPPPAAVPPPLPRRTAVLEAGQVAPHPRSSELGSPLDARAAFEIDLEPPPSRAVAEPDPFSPIPAPDDPFAASFTPAPTPAHERGAPAAPPTATDPFGANPADDPFAAVQAPVPEALLRAPPAQAGAAFEGDDPFGASLPPLGGAGGPLEQAGPDLALEERTTPPPRAARPQSSAPMDDPFGGPADQGPAGFEGGLPGDIPPMTSDQPGEPFGGFMMPARAAPPPPVAPRAEAPLRVDPFASAEVDANPLQVGAAPEAEGAATRPGRAPAPEAEGESLGARRLSRLRAAAVNAISLLLLLAMALAILVVWRGHVPLSQAVHPSALLAALTRGGEAEGPFQARRVTSGFYERARGAPVLFVRGEVLAQGPVPVGVVRVSVDLLKGGAVVAHGEAVAGAILSPEELHGAADAEALGRAARAAEAVVPAPVRPGQALPFLVAIADYPADLSGASLRVVATGEARR